MESVIYKYSDFFDNDGGFDKVRREFDQLGDDLIKKAKDVREKTKLFDVDQADSIKEAEQQAESLSDAFKKYGKAKEDLTDIEKEYRKQVDKSNESQGAKLDELVKLDKELKAYQSRLKTIITNEKAGAKLTKEDLVLKQELKLRIKDINSETSKLQKEILDTNKLTVSQNKLIKARIVLEKSEVKTLADVRERMSALRLVVQSLDFKTQGDQIKAYNDEIDELTETLGENSDKFIQSKINIGNYEESITNALKSSGAFQTNIAGLDGVLQSVLGVFLMTRVELEAMEASADANTNAIKRMTIAFGKLNKVLKVSIIGAVLVLVGALASAFGNTRAGAVRLEKVMATLGNVFTTFGQVAKIAVESVYNTFKEVNEFLANPFAKRQKKTADDTESAWKRIQDAIKNGGDAIVAGLDNIDRAFKLEDRVKRLTQEIETLNGVLSITQSIADDSTKSLSTQLFASQKALALTEEVGKRQLEIARSELEIANERVKQSIKANAVEAGNINLGLKGEAFAKATLDLAEKRGVSLEVANDLIDEQQSALLEVMKAENELNLTKQENSRQQREINRDIFEQNLDLLIDLIDTEKNISEAYVNDITNNFKKRINEFNRFIVAFRSNAQKELDEFTKEASNMGLDLDFKIAYDENGDFQVFVNDSELAIDNIVELNEQLQGTGMNEIDINRFREFIVESRNGIRDFKLLNKELVLAGINIKEISSNIGVSQDELNSLNDLELRIQKLKDLSESSLSQTNRDKIAKDLIELEKERTRITELAEFQRIQNRKEAIDLELETVEEGSQRYYELIQARLDLEKQLRNKNTDDLLSKTKEANKKALEDYKKFGDEVKKVLDLVLDKVLEVNQKRVESAEDQVEKQGELIDLQQERAQAGLENTLAFEQRELGKREAELIKRQKKQERLEKIKALYSSYNNYSSQGDGNAIQKALRDFAILEAISATFKDGGITGIDGVKTNRNGVTLGKSHDRNGRGGNLAWHERGEGFLPKKAVDNIGHSNFYKLREMALNGNMDSNFFSGQRKEFIQSTNMIATDPALKEEIRQVRQAVERKPVSNWRVDEITKGTINVVEEVINKNTVKRNHFIIKKPRP